MTRKILTLCAAAFFLAAFTAGTAGIAGAARGGRNATAATAPSVKLAAGSQAWLGGSVTFTATWPSTVKNPRVSVTCYDPADTAHTTIIFGETGTWDHVFVLGGAGSLWLWNPGPASCTAELYEIVWNGNNPQQWTTYATTTFDAAATAP